MLDGQRALRPRLELLALSHTLSAFVCHYEKGWEVKAAREDQ